MDLNDKIKQILVDKSISPSHFADEIGVQRSSVSHILAGRNKPSLDIVQKIIRRYPDLGMEWIMDEEDLPNVEPDRSEVNSGNIRQEAFPRQSSTPLDLPEKKKPEPSTVQRNLGAIQIDQISPQTAQKSIERILVFYSDGTFKQYTPQ
ncbi:helix-turn-helix transcriptional regulator [Persicitalea jodogahamensis]|uniref:Transcriptional regulator n=1 Tax=Persicitalea jodogahamensis TaxID=402147 RepID=A0A8J3DE53_9BACT|nr:helix-turn-helix transcriptional regulator [Persicitalea jodogahamensis]GHB82239.1 transcriptional regulator [Persicitalea jodogahamensis]